MGIETHTQTLDFVAPNSVINHMKQWVTYKGVNVPTLKKKKIGLSSMWA